jgi:hypothetical protein
MSINKINMLSSSVSLTKSRNWLYQFSQSEPYRLYNWRRMLSPCRYLIWNINNRAKVVLFNISDTPLLARRIAANYAGGGGREGGEISSCRFAKVISHVRRTYCITEYIRAIKILHRFLSVIDARKPAQNRRSLFNVCELFICPSFIREVIRLGSVDWRTMKIIFPIDDDRSH